MATTFMEPGTDATQDFKFYSSTGVAIAPSSSTTSPRTGPRDIAPDSSHTSWVNKSGILADAGGRVCICWKSGANLPGGTSTLLVSFQVDGTTVVWRLRVSTTGKLQLWNATVQVGTTSTNAVRTSQISNQINVAW